MTGAPNGDRQGVEDDAHWHALGIGMRSLWPYLATSDKCVYAPNHTELSARTPSVMFRSTRGWRERESSKGLGRGAGMRSSGGVVVGDGFKVQRRRNSLPSTVRRLQLCNGTVSIRTHMHTRTKLELDTIGRLLPQGLPRDSRRARRHGSAPIASPLHHFIAAASPHHPSRFLASSRPSLPHRLTGMDPSPSARTRPRCGTASSHGASQFCLC